MKKSVFMGLTLFLFLIAAVFTYQYISAQNIEAKGKKSTVSEPAKSGNDIKAAAYSYPEFYRGIYLNVVSAKKMDKLKEFIEKSKNAEINTFVMDVQSSRHLKCIVPAENVKLCMDNGIHPIARVVIFPDGLRKWPVSKKYIQDRLDIAESACKNGFREIQFDYIRFNDSSANRHLKYSDRYNFIESFITKAKARLKKYDVKIAADVFGRIPLNKNDIIGQQMESLDKVVDIICPMAYPSHYTWSRKLQTDPYHTVFITSKRARERAKNAQIVTYIQAFKMKLYGMPYDKYLREQIRAVHDSKIKGYLLWNARQVYTVPFRVAKNFYSKNKKKVAKN